VDPEHGDDVRRLLETTHLEQPHYSPAIELYPGSTFSPTGCFAASTHSRNSIPRS
jgi:hypothetical protein